jgi:hypothetical protein
MLQSAPAAQSRVNTPIRQQSVQQHDLDLHGIVGIRLLDATPADRQAVTAQLGPIAKRLDRDPDIVIRFTDRLQTSGPLRFIGAAEAAFTDDAFLILRSRYKSPARVQIAFDEIGRQCEIVCERGLRAVPLLLAIINLTVLARGGIALHATAFHYRGRDIVVTGWSKSGKTEMLLAFLEHGAHYIGDEWIYLSPDGSTICGIPEPVRVWDWQLAQLPHYRGGLDRGSRLRLGALRFGSACLGAAARFSGPAVTRHVQRLQGLVERQRYAFLRPANAFAGGASPTTGTLGHVFFLMNAEVPAAYAQRVDPEWVAERMVFSLAEERQPLMSAYRQFRFAFPQRRSALVEAASSMERRRLSALLAGHPCHVVYHPYPPSILRLYDTVAPLLAT